jgi:thymidine kinase
MVTGLNLDYMGQPFSNMAHLVAIADKVIFLKATCKNCSEFKPALYSHFLKKDNESGRIIIGDANYIPLCRNCYYICN